MSARIELAGWLRPPEKDFLTSDELAMVRVLFDAILPGDRARQIPSAREAGAAEFVSRLLGERVAGDPEVYWEVSKKWRQLYRDGLQMLDARTTKTHGVTLKNLPQNEVIGLLMQLEQLEQQWESRDAVPEETPEDLKEMSKKKLFKTLRRHCIQGCFSDPRWGGNLNKLMWRAMGYAQPAEDVFP